MGWGGGISLSFFFFSDATLHRAVERDSTRLCDYSRAPVAREGYCGVAAVGSYAFSTRHVCSSDTHTTNKEGLGGSGIGWNRGPLYCATMHWCYSRIYENTYKSKTEKKTTPQNEKNKKKKSNFGKAKKFGCATPCPFSLIPFFLQRDCELRNRRIVKKKKKWQ